LSHYISGKSTTAGHLLCKCGGVDEQKIEEFENEADKFQKRSSKYAWVFDQLAAERERGITMNISLKSFESSRFKFNIIDVPGRRDLIKEMITGTSQADVGLLVVDASKGNYEVGIDDNGQTKEHCLLAYTLGVKQLVVAINKMDDKTVNFSENRWKIIRGEIATYLKKVGYKPMKIPFIPISGWQGDNLDSKSIHMPWYGGPTLLEALNNVTAPKRPIDKPLRVPIQDVRNIEGIGAVLVGRVESGVLKPGMNIQLAPPGTLGVVESLQINFQIVPRAIPGDIVSINIKDRWNGVMIARPGQVLSNYDDRPAQEVSSFEAQIIIMNHPGKISNGYTPIIDCHTSHTPCTFVNIKEKLDKRTGKILVQNPDNVQTGDVCIVKVEPKIPLCVEQFKDFPPLGRFCVRDLGRTVAVGVVKTIINGDAEEES
jgi:elongation factor 1-alpha